MIRARWWLRPNRAEEFRSQGGLLDFGAIPQIDDFVSVATDRGVFYRVVLFRHTPLDKDAAIEVWLEPTAVPGMLEPEQPQASAGPKLGRLREGPGLR